MQFDIEKIKYDTLHVRNLQVPFQRISENLKSKNLLQKSFFLKVHYIKCINICYYYRFTSKSTITRISLRYALQP